MSKHPTIESQLPTCGRQQREWQRGWMPFHRLFGSSMESVAPPHWKEHRSDWFLSLRVKRRGYSKLWKVLFLEMCFCTGCKSSFPESVCQLKQGWCSVAISDILNHYQFALNSINCLNNLFVWKVEHKYQIKYQTNSVSKSGLNLYRNQFSPGESAAWLPPPS